MKLQKQDTFRIGISMAGAVSAGAYTAGVMDYLIEALENWQNAKELHLPGVPLHNVVIEVLSGASAGGMTAVITAAAIQKRFPPVGQKNYQTKAGRENPLFDAWVNQTEHSKSDMMSQLLDNDDILNSPEINPHKEVRSIFNSLFIEKIASRILSATMKDPSVGRPYFASDLELFTTLTNLRGFNYELEFITESGRREDRMTMHRDLIHLQLNPSGTYREDGKIPFHFETPEGLNKNLLVDAAIATGAFPAGLAPRVVVRDPKYINDNHLLRITHGKKYLVDPLTDYCAVCVDGGVINNEPYDLADKILTNRAMEKIRDLNGKRVALQTQNETAASTFDTILLMIDPFPNWEEPPSSAYLGLQALKFTSFQLFGAMRQQLMVKSDLLERAFDENDFSRFMIAPIRTSKNVRQNNSLACGSVNGFGGFFSRKFRVHDYMLGRRNCQRFLQEYFCVPAEAGNPVIECGYGHLKEDGLRLLRTSDGKSLPIIPDIRLSLNQTMPNQTFLVRPAAEDEFTYPSIGLKYLMQLEDRIKNRLDVVLKNLNNSNDPEHVASSINPIVRQIRRESWFKRNFISPLGNFASDRFVRILKNSGKGLVATKFIDMVIADMDEKELLKHDL
ncbi:MAG TPA: patatin-like phospholipase family protein [Prolixibacteraceae bacterium]